MLKRRKKTVLYETEEVSWPIPIWRPRTGPLVPLHKKVINLLSPRPQLDIAISPLHVPSIQHVGRGEGGAGVQRRISARARRKSGLAVQVEEAGTEPGSMSSMGMGMCRPDCGVSDKEAGTRTVVTPKITITPSFSGLPSEPIHLPMEVSKEHTGGPSKKRDTLSTCSTDRTRYMSSSRRRHTNRGSYRASQTSADILPLHLDQMDQPFSTGQGATHREDLLHLLRLLHCLDLARQLLYSYNRLALLSLDSAPFPRETARDWEADMDEWWAETSGVLNFAHKRVKVKFGHIEALWIRQLGAPGKSIEKEKRALWRAWTREEKPSWSDSIVPHRQDFITSRRLPLQRQQDRSPKPEPENGDSRRSCQVPDWVTAIVPEPFTPDELEEELWILEDQGKVPTGTYSRMYGKGLIRTFHLNGSRKVNDYRLTREEDEEAERLEVRGMDVDEQGRLEREVWRRRGR